MVVHACCTLARLLADIFGVWEGTCEQRSAVSASNTGSLGTCTPVRLWDVGTRAGRGDGALALALLPAEAFLGRKEVAPARPGANVSVQKVGEDS